MGILRDDYYSALEALQNLSRRLELSVEGRTSDQIAGSYFGGSAQNLAVRLGPGWRR
jgi:hypothetical protein